MNFIKQQLLVFLFIPSFVWGMESTMKKGKEVQKSSSFELIGNWNEDKSQEELDADELENYLLAQQFPNQSSLLTTQKPFLPSLTSSSMTSATVLEKATPFKGEIIKKEGRDIVFYKSKKELGRISSSDKSLTNLFMFMCLKNLPFEIQHYIALLLLRGELSNSYSNFKKAQCVTDFPFYKKSPDNKLLLMGPCDGKMGIRDGASGDLISSWVEELWAEGECYNEKRFACFSPDGKAVFRRGIVRNVVSGSPIFPLPNYSPQKFPAACFSPDSKVLAAELNNNTMSLWDIEKQEELLTIEGQTPLGFSSDGNSILTKSGELTLHLFDRKTGAYLVELEDSYLSCLEIQPLFTSHDTIVVHTLNQSGTIIFIWDGIKGLQLARIHIPHWIDVWAISSNKKILVTGSNEGKVYLWDTKTGKQLSVLEGHTGYVSYVALSPDGTKILTGSEDKTVCLWNKSSGQKLYEINHSRLPRHGSFNSDGKSFFTSEALIMDLYDTQTGQLQLQLEITDKEFDKSKNDTRSFSNTSSPSFSSLWFFDDRAIVLFLRTHPPKDEWDSPSKLSAQWWTGYSKEFMDWINSEISHSQAWLILQILQADKANISFSIIEQSAEGKIFMEIPEKIQEYLIKRYSIKLLKEEISSDSSSNCLVQ